MSPSVPLHRRLVSRILSPALQFWLRSQVEQVEALQAQIQGSDRQILRGQIPQVSVVAQRVIYQGLHLSQIELRGDKIRFNLGQVLKGQPLRLLEPIPVQGALLLRETDVNASLHTPLLRKAIQDFLLQLLGSDLVPGVATGTATSDTLLGSSANFKKDSPQNQALDLRDLQVAIAADQLTLSGILISQQGNRMPVILRTGLHLTSPHQLQLQQPQWLTSFNSRRGLPLTDLEGYILDLGTDVAFDHFSLEPEQLSCQGQIWVRP